MAKRRSKGEGTIYYSDTLQRWVAQITLPNGKRKSKYGKTQAEVKGWLLVQRKQLIDGMVVDDLNTTFEEFLDRWFVDFAQPRLKPSTLATHESIIRNHIKPTIGNIRLSKLTPAHIQSLSSQKFKDDYQDALLSTSILLFIRRWTRLYNGGWLPEMFQMS